MNYGTIASSETTIKPVIDSGAHPPVTKVVPFKAAGAAKTAGEILSIGAQGYGVSYDPDALGPVISAITAAAGTAFLKNVHIRPGHRPASGNWTFTFPTATTITVTPPGGSAGAAVTVAANTTYDGTITGAEDFYIETATLTVADSAVVAVSYTAGVSIVPTLASPGNAFAAVAAIAGLAGKLAKKGLYKVVTTATTVTVGFNGSAQSAAKVIAADGVYLDIIPGFVFTAEGTAVTAETNYFLVDVADPLGIAGVLAENVDPSAETEDVSAVMLWHGAVKAADLTVGGVAAVATEIEELEKTGRIFAV